VNWAQIALGGATLLLGLLVYLMDRPADQVYFLWRSGLSASSSGLLPGLLGRAGKSLPALLHVLALILLTAGVLGARRRGCLAIAVGWLLTDAAFEIGQGYGGGLSAHIPGWFQGIPLLEAVGGFFRYGTFDPLDLAATGLGAVVGYGLCWLTTAGRTGR
jgi:hypothetical protein